MALGPDPRAALTAVNRFGFGARPGTLSRIAADGMVLLRRQLFDRLVHADLGLFSQQSASQLATRPAMVLCRVGSTRPTVVPLLAASAGR